MTIKETLNEMDDFDTKGDINAVIHGSTYINYSLERLLALGFNETIIATGRQEYARAQQEESTTQEPPSNEQEGPLEDETQANT